jgi:ATP-dependent RNA helicase DeaD
VRVSIPSEKRAPGKMPRIRQVAYLVPRMQKTMALGRILDVETPTSAIVFCRTRTEVDELTDTLTAHGFAAKALHGGMEQKARDRVMQLFRGGQADVLVATDVAARGLDIEHVSHVINYDLPMAPEVYVHRIGRTGRAGREGLAISLVDPRQHRALRQIEGVTRSRIEILKVPSEADLQARRLDTTLAAIKAQINEGGLEQARSVVDRLAAEFDVLDVAAAAVRLLHDDVAAGAAATPRSRGKKGAADSGDQSRALDEALASVRLDDGARPERTSARDKGGSTAGRRREAESRSTDGPPRGKGRPRGAGPLTVLHINIGRSAGVRPADLVGAIAGEADVDSGVIGAIRIGDDSSLVEIPEGLATRVMVSLRNAKVRGRRVVVRRDRGRESD